MNMDIQQQNYFLVNAMRWYIFIKSIITYVITSIIN